MSECILESLQDEIQAALNGFIYTTVRRHTIDAMKQQVERVLRDFMLRSDIQMPLPEVIVTQPPDDPSNFIIAFSYADKLVEKFWTDPDYKEIFYARHQSP